MLPKKDQSTRDYKCDIWSKLIAPKKKDTFLRFINHEKEFDIIYVHLIEIGI